MIKLDSTFKIKRHYFTNQGPYSQSYCFSSSHVWIWELDHKEKLSAKELMILNSGVGEDSWESDWTVMSSNESTLKEIIPEYSLEALMLKLQYFDHLMWRTDSLEKTLMLGEIKGRRRRGWQRMRLSYGITNSMDMSLSKPQALVMDREACHAVVHWVAQSRTWWMTELNLSSLIS